MTNKTTDITHPNTPHQARLKALRTLMKKHGITYYLLPRTDEFQSEYLPQYAERLAFLSAFTGSFGFGVIGLERAIIFTDGRYSQQIKKEVDSHLFESESRNDHTPFNWLKSQLKKGDIIGYNPWLFTENALAPFQKLGAPLKAIEENLIDAIWEEQPPKPQGIYHPFDIQYAGRSSEDKINEICIKLKKAKADALLLTRPDSIAWLLNIRGEGDIPYNPLLLSYCLLKQDGSYQLYSFNKAHPAPETILKDLKKYKNQCIWLDPKTTPLALQNILDEKNIHKADDPCILLKACKNKIELKGTQIAHIKDGFAVSEFYHWFDTHSKPTGLSELDLVLKLLLFRQKQEHFKGNSFPTICGASWHGAIIHYAVNHASNQMVENDQLVLLDSGGQYFEGTTDITRVFKVGTPTPQMKRDYTLVLKGHIALSSAIFPKGTRGYQLDTLARQYLWKEKCDYLHGTGHGVGHYACVHEGPQNCSPRPIDVPLKPGMILSNEPGLYRPGEYGIRLENLVQVKPLKDKGLLDTEYYCLEPFTLVPFEHALIEKSLLSSDEIEWLNHYHSHVLKMLKESGLQAEKEGFWEWLEMKCQPL